MYLAQCTCTSINATVAMVDIEREAWFDCRGMVLLLFDGKNLIVCTPRDSARRSPSKECQPVDLSLAANQTIGAVAH